MCFAVKLICSGHNILEKAPFFAFVKVAVAMHNIHQFASNLTPLLMCLKLTLICCEDVPLIRNSLNSQPQIALAEHGRIPGDATPHSYCMSTPTARRGRAIYHHTPLGNERGSVPRKLFCSRLVCFPSQGRESQPCILMMEMIGHCTRWICPRASGNQCREETKLAWQNVWHLKAIKAWARTLIRTQTLPQTLEIISASVRVSQRNTRAAVAGFSCFHRTNMENKVPINVPACQVNNAWSWVNNWSHTPYTFSSSLCWIIEGGIVFFWCTSGFLLPSSSWRCFTFASVSYNKKPSVWAELHHCCSHSTHDLWMSAGHMRSCSSKNNSSFISIYTFHTSSKGFTEKKSHAPSESLT